MTDYKAISEGECDKCLLGDERIDCSYVDCRRFAEVLRTHDAEVRAETIAEIIRKAEEGQLDTKGTYRYRWHDLRKDARDLPSHENDVEVVDHDGKHLIAQYKRIWHPILNVPMDDKTWSLPQYCSQKYIIKWRELEPFEEET